MRILLVEDDQDSCESISEFLQGLGHNVKECSNGREAIAYLNMQNVDLVLTDIKMPKMNGIELLKALKSRIEQGLSVILMTGHGDMESAIEALRAGACDYLLKPIKLQELITLLEKVSKNLTEETHQQNVPPEDLALIKQAIKKITGIGENDVHSPIMQKIFQQAVKLHNDREIPVLIQGETGTGKEIIARLVHEGLQDYQKPFVDINCAAINSNLFESELFGYEAGAFTGAATKGNHGKLHLAAGGTLFLDEIGEMSLELQAKLLRVIQEKEYYRLGGLKKLKTDVRIICATNVNLEERVATGEFRSDLFYRLNVGQIHIPALRDRQAEILPLAEMFLQFFAQRKNKQFKAISSEAARLLLNYPWPGNVRELRNTLEWLVFNYDDTIVRPEHLEIININCHNSDKPEVPAIGSSQDTSLSGDLLSLADHTNQIVLNALKLHAGNKAQTARYLGISRRALYRRLERMEKGQD